MRFILSIAIMLAAVPSAMAQGTVAPEIGRIESVTADFDPDSGDAYVLHDGHKVVPRAHIVFLHPGDSISVLVPQLDVGYSLIGSDAIKHVTQNDGPVVLSGQWSLEASFCTLVNCDFVRRVRQAAWVPTVVHTHAHGAEAAPIMPSRLLPVVDQVLPRSSSQIVVLWSGGAGTARVDQEHGARSDVDFQLLALPNTDAFKVTVVGEDGGSLSWQVRIVDRDPPAPSGFGTQPTDEDRLERALYLLQPAADRAPWRLFAISELAELRASSITADIAWRQVIAGNYQAE